MKRIKLIGLALLAVFALSALAASVAQAVQAPYYGVESKKLEGTTEIEATQLSEYSLTAGLAKITCKESGVLPGAEILNTNEVGTSKETIEYKKCTIAGNGTCSVGNASSGKIITNPLKNELVYDATSKESKSVAVEFTPETGKVLSKITLVGSGCTPFEQGVLAVEGQIVGQAFGGPNSSSLFLLELGVAPVLATSGAIKFPEKRITSIVLIENGVSKLVTTSFKFSASAASLVGETEVKLKSGQKWCIIS